MTSSKESNDPPVLISSDERKARYEALVREYYTDIYRYAYWLSKSPSVAEDLVQETFLRAWRSLDSLQSIGAAKAWLFTIVRREHARLYEKYRPEFDDIDDHAIIETRQPEPEDALEQRMLHKAMAALEPDYRDPLLLQVIGGFSGEEIAQMLDLNANTVMTRLFRARNQLRDKLSATPDKD